MTVRNPRHQRLQNPANRAERKATPKARNRAERAGVHSNPLTWMAMNTRRRKSNSSKPRRRRSGVFAKARRSSNRKRAANPHPHRRRRSNLFSKARRRKANPGVPMVRRRRRTSVFGRARRSSNRRRNPEFKSVLRALPYTIGGGILTRSLPETFLPNMNTGFVGYGLNLLTGYGLSMLAEKFGGAAAGEAVLLGAAMATVSRGIEDYFNVNLVKFANYQQLVQAGHPPAAAASAAAAAPASTGVSGDMKYRLTKSGLSGNFTEVGFTVPTSSLLNGNKVVRRVAASPARPAGVSGNGGWVGNLMPFGQQRMALGGR